MAKVTVPDEPGNLCALMKALEDLNRRAGRPSLREIADGQTFSYASVHTLFTKTLSKAPKWRVLEAVVLMLAEKALGADPQQLLRQFYDMYLAADEAAFEAAAQKSVSKPSEVKIEYELDWDVLDERMAKNMPSGNLRNLMMELLALFESSGRTVTEVALKTGFPQKMVHRLFTTPPTALPDRGFITSVVEALWTLSPRFDPRNARLLRRFDMLIKAAEAQPFETWSAQKRPPAESPLAKRAVATRKAALRLEESKLLSDGHVVIRIGDIRPGNLRVLMEELHRLWLSSGRRMRDVGEEAGCSPDSLYWLLVDRHVQVPNQGLIMAVVEAIVRLNPNLKLEGHIRHFRRLIAAAEAEPFETSSGIQPDAPIEDEAEATPAKPASGTSHIADDAAMPFIPPGNLNRVIAELHLLYRNAGRPGMRTLALQAGCDEHQVRKLFTARHTQFPNPDLLILVAIALLRLAPNFDEAEGLRHFRTLMDAAHESPFDSPEETLARLSQADETLVIGPPLQDR